MENIIQGIMDTYHEEKEYDGKITINDFVRGLEEFLNDLDEENNWTKEKNNGNDRC